MKQNIIATTILGISTLLGGCADLGFDFDFQHDSPEYLIVAEEGTKADSPLLESEALAFSELEFTGGWTSFTFEAGVGEIDERVNGLEVLHAGVRGTAGFSEYEADLDFVQRMEIYVVGDDGLPSFLLASYERDGELRDPSTLPLYIHEEINLLSYMEDDLKFYTFLQGEMPDRNVTFRMEMDFRAYSRGY